MEDKMGIVEKITNVIGEGYNLVKDKENWGWSVDNQSILKKALSEGRKLVGICGVHKPRIIEWPLVTLDSFDRTFVEGVPLKTGEYFFRIIPRLAVDEMPLVKVNPHKGLIYFLTEEGKEADYPIFETKGTKLVYFRYVKEAKILD